MITWRCTIHDMEFGHGAPPKDLQHLRNCPLCLDTELTTVRAERDEAIEQRDLLLRAIDLKKTIERVKFK